MSDLEMTNWYLDRLKQDTGGEIKGGLDKAYATVTSLPFWLADKAVEGVVGTLKTLEETMYKNPASFEPEKYASKMFELASNVVGGGIGASSLVEGEVGGTVLAMNKMDAISQMGRVISGKLKNLSPEERISFLEKVQPMAQDMLERVGQETYDALNSVSDIALSGGKKAQFERSSKGLSLDIAKAETAQDLQTSLGHELAHGVNWSSGDERAALLYKYTGDARKKAMEYVEAAPDQISFNDLEKNIYARHDPEEAFATYAGKEFGETNLPIETIINDYLDKFSKIHEGVASAPRDRRGFDLGADWNKVFKNIYTDNIAARALREIELKDGKLF
jgi:hypothetical protein